MSSDQINNGQLIVISGPSGVGKSTIVKMIMDKLDNAFLSVSATTREKGKGEVEGENYHYISRDEFERMIRNGELLEYAEVFGNYYGTPKKPVDEAMTGGKDVILEIDVQGAKEAKRTYPQARLIFIVPPSAKELAQRLNNRGRDCEEAAKKRLAQAEAEIAAGWQYYDHMVINADLEMAVDEIVSIIKDKSGDLK